MDNVPLLVYAGITVVGFLAMAIIPSWHALAPRKRGECFIFFGAFLFAVFGALQAFAYGADSYRWAMRIDVAYAACCALHAWCVYRTLYPRKRV